ncbi:MAG TPA: phosphoesterase, partial [Bacillota bacterium]|nr:phosphoesterase [Bacillota bacterium]
TARSSVRVRNHNTDMVLATLYSNSIKVLTHPGDKAPFDMIEIIKACEKTGTWMEINCPHAALSTEDIKTAADYDVGFIIGSDAHAAKDVGLPDRALDRVFRAGLGPERIVNLIWKP